MDRNSYGLQSSPLMKNLKYFIKANDDRAGQFYSEPGSSYDATPKSTKNSKLEPIDYGLLNKKVAYLEPTTPTPNKPSPRSGIAGTLSPKASKQFKTPQRTWLNAMDGDLTPQDGKKTPGRRSKFANSLMTTVEQGKNNASSFSEQVAQLFQMPLTTKASFTHETIFMNPNIAPQQQTEEEEKVSPHLGRPESKQSQSSHTLSLPSYRIAKRKVLESGLVVSKNSRMEETYSDNEFNKKTQHIKYDVCATLPYRHFIFGPQIELDIFKKHLMILHKGLVYATKNLKSPSEKFIRSKQVIIPDPYQKRTKTLLLDLDETLIHSCLVRDNPDVILTYQGNGLESPRQLPVKLRPYLKEFLNTLSQYYEIIIFTASASAYARTIINYIDKDKKLINAILSREHCMETKNGFFIKDLRILKDRELKNMIIVDNLAHSFGFQLENGVPILEYINDKKDEELKHLTEYLLEAYKYDDLREFNKERLKLHDFASKKIDDIFNKFGIL